MLDQPLAPLVLTSGEPAGIGPDLCLALLKAPPSYPVEILVDQQLLADRARQLGCEIEYQQALVGGVDNITFRFISTSEKVKAGALNAANVSYVMALIDTAIEGVETGRYSGIVTLPVHKEIINQTGLRFSGHTEYLQSKAGVSRVVMLFAHKHFKVALATTHLPLREVPDAITTDLILGTVGLINQELKDKWHVSSPHIALTGLNPHAGEGGYLGYEEQHILLPAIAQLHDLGIHVTGPYPADTIFHENILSQYDAILAMYHDQALPVVKSRAFFQAVNVTLGLPYVRTSVDHGTALSLAGTGQADSGSLQAAINLAGEIVAR